MKTFRRRSSLSATGLLLAAILGLAISAPAAPATSAAKTLNNSTRTKERIDALLKRRLKPEPLPAALPNPFQLGGSAAIVEPRENPAPDSGQPPGGDTANPDTTAPANDTEALARYISQLKFSGTVQLNGRTQLIINQSPYKEGDLIFMDNKNAVTYLQVIKITPTELTLGLNQAVQTIKLKVN